MFAIGIGHDEIGRIDIDGSTISRLAAAGIISKAVAVSAARAA